MCDIALYIKVFYSIFCMPNQVIQFLLVFLILYIGNILSKPFLLAPLCIISVV